MAALNTEIDADLKRSFASATARRGKQLKQGVAEALRLWLEKEDAPLPDMSPQDREIAGFTEAIRRIMNDRDTVSENTLAVIRHAIATWEGARRRS